MTPPLGCLLLLDVFVILLAAHTFGALARRVGQPRVLGEVVAGIVLGPTILGQAAFALFQPEARSLLGSVGRLGLVLFMFLVGLELDLGLLAGRARAIATIGVGVVTGSVALGLLIGPLLYDEHFVAAFGTADQPSRLGFALTIGALLSTTALPVSARILQDGGAIRSPVGSIAVAAAGGATVLAFFQAATAADVATGRSTRHLALGLALVAGYLAVLLLVVRPALHILGRRCEVQGTLTPTILATIIVLVIASAYLAERVGISMIAGSFLTGVVVPARANLGPAITSRLSRTTTSVLLPVFLAVSGLRTDFGTLRLDILPGLALFVVAGIAGHCLSGTLFGRLGGLSWGQAKIVAVLMNCRGLVVLVIALAALDAGVITGAMQAAAVSLALITTAMTAPLLKRLLLSQAPSP